MGINETHGDDLREIAGFLQKCSSILFVTGAGISAESGLPTYRGIGGLYDVDTTEEGLPIEVLLSGSMMSIDPAVSWKYIREIEQACRGARFSKAHQVLAEMEERFDRFWILTQNVDSLHSDAGNDNVIEIHGNLRRLKCVSCSYRENVENFEHLPEVPECQECGGLIRPDVVLFGELLPREEVDLLQVELARGFDAVFTVGTSSVFPYIKDPVHLARTSGALTVEINPGKTEVSEVVDFKLSMTSEEALTAIWNLFLETKP